MRATLLLTRPEAQAKRFARQARAHLGADVAVVISSVLRIALSPPETLPEGAALVFSSENAVRAACGIGTTADGKGPLFGRFAYCVGDRTAQAARAAGCTARSAQGSARDLIALIVADQPSQPLLYLHGQTVRVDVVAALRAQGLMAQAQVVYEQIPQPMTAQAQRVLAGRAPVLLPLFSPRSAVLMSEAAQHSLAPLHVVALSAQVAQAWTGPNRQVQIAAQPDVAHVLDRLTCVLGNTLS